jgi:prophage maintenance system killer protein
MMMTACDLAALIWSCARIEMPTVTLDDVNRALRADAAGGHDILIIRNVAAAWTFLLADDADPAVDWAHISEYNRLLTAGLTREPGAMRRFPVGMTGTGWTPAMPTLDDARAAIASATAPGDARERAIRLFLTVCRGQWFEDGNKRTAIMAANHVMVRSGAGLFMIPDGADPAFRASLVRYYESGDGDAIGRWLRARSVVPSPIAGGCYHREGIIE